MNDKEVGSKLQKSINKEGRGTIWKKRWGEGDTSQIFLVLMIIVEIGKCPPLHMVVAVAVGNRAGNPHPFGFWTCYRASVQKKIQNQ